MSLMNLICVHVCDKFLFRNTDPFYDPSVDKILKEKRGKRGINEIHLVEN